MTFDFASFALGFLGAFVVAWLGYQIIRITEEHHREVELWNRVQSESSPSQTYWGHRITERETLHPLDDEGWVRIRPHHSEHGTP